MTVVESLRSTLRNGYRNLVGTVVVSLLVSLSMLPLAATTTVGTVPAVLGGLWTSCLLLGITLIAGFRFATTVAERGVPIAVLPPIRATLGTPMTGLALGGLTFLITTGSLVLVSVIPPAYGAFAVGIAVTFPIEWYLLVAFSVPELGAGQPLSASLRTGLARLLDAPRAAAVFLTASFLFVLLAGVTVITIGLFLPGTLCLLAAHVTLGVDADHSAG
ncbi:hypothetical protein [Haloarcula brevis]|uniref:hypothetical protein n=1 Tax=Haloarcula brevis TaxID=3111453 RepID=UPI00300EF89E